MIRLLFLVLFIASGAAVAIGLKSCQERRSAAAAERPVRNFSRDVAILGDGTPMFAPNGTIARTLDDWLADETSTSRYFEVGGQQFNGRTMDPTPEAKARLTRLAAMLTGYPKVEATVIGHASRSDDAKADMLLSEKRAELVVRLLEEQGIRPQRLSAVGRGSIEPLANGNGAAADRIGLLLAYPDRVSAPAR
jgi:outer membrane protein OmpA-like peptidoglycan-associated protein